MNFVLSCLPALITILMAFCTHSVLKALASGVAVACVIITGADPVAMAQLILQKLGKVFEADKLMSLSTLFDSKRVLIFLFLIVLGAIIHLIVISGSSNAYLRFTSRFINSRPKVEASSLCLPFLLFVDDYLSAIMTSCIMPRLTDKFGVSRIKLSYLITAVAAPICAIVPISSWAAVIVLLIADSGVSTQVGWIIYADPFYTLLQAIPTMFYCLMSIVCAFVVAIFSIDLDCQTNGNNKDRKEVTDAGPNCISVCSKGTNATFFDFLFPIATIATAVIATILHTGNVWNGQGIIQALTNGSAEKGLFFGSLAAFCLSAALYVSRQLIKPGEVLESVWEGFWSMKDSMLILTMSAILSEFLKQELGTCTMISQKLIPLISQQFLPFSFFIICAVVAFAIGSSWATMSVIFPIAASITSQTPNPEILIVPVIGAILSGVIFGNSLSPMSDLIAMTSRNTKVNLIQYIKAQFLYLTPVGIGSGVAFLVCTPLMKGGYKIAVFAGLSTGLGVSIMLLSALNLYKNRQ